MKKVLVVDNYDSFTYNLVHIIEELNGYAPDVYRNDEINAEGALEYDYILISPGPGIPEESGNTLDIISSCLKEKKIFGVCLGLQALTVALGGTLVNLEKVYHGIESQMHLTDETSALFKGVPSQFQAGRYHSWVVDKDSLPKKLKISCVDDEGRIMALEHTDYPVYAVQFHPESIMTPEGKKMIQNFLEL